MLAHDGLDDAAAEIAAWERSGIRLLTVLDPDYPENLRTVYDRPPLIFVAGSLRQRGRTLGRRRRDARSLARGSRPRATGNRAPRRQRLHGDLRTGGRDRHAGPHDGAALRRPDRRRARHGPAPLLPARERRTCSGGSPATARVVSQFWPDSPPTATSFVRRNATMSGLAMGTVVVEASHTSGARAQARLALEHGRPVFLPEPLLEERLGARVRRQARHARRARARGDHRDDRTAQFTRSARALGPRRCPRSPS